MLRFHWSSLLLLLVPLGALGGEPEVADVFVPKKDGFKSIRIPAVVVTKKGTVLAFAEGRAANADQAKNKIVLKRSSDGGKTWSKLAVIAEDGDKPMNNPCAVVERASGLVLLMYQTYPAGIAERSNKLQTGYEGERIVRNFLITSADDGVTWSKPRDVTRETKRPTKVTTMAVGPGIGIQLRHGKHAGRLLFPFNEGPFGLWNIYAVYSDDQGKSWQRGEIAPGGLVDTAKGGKTSTVNEAQFVELKDGSIRFNVRHWAGKPVRKTCVSADGGVTWSKVEDVPELRDPSCMASILRYPDAADGAKSRILFSGPQSNKRENGTIFLSFDEGATWPIRRVLDKGSFGYSCLTALPDGTIGCLYETAGANRIVFARFTLAWLTEDKERGEAKEKPPNIVFILADDVGYGDLSCYGAKLVHTKHLDRLARQGCRFTDAHSPASTCTPTRRAFLTGQYSWRREAGSRILPGNAPLCIAPGTATLPALLQRAGYKTAVVGKWHLGLGAKDGPDWNSQLKPGPLEIGFDYAFFMPATGDRVPCVYVEDRRIVGLDPKDPIRVSYQHKVGDEPTGRDNPELLKLKPTHGHDMTIVNGISRIGWMSGGKAARWRDEDMADTFVKKAVGFMEKNKDNPFFLYLALHDIHVPRVPHPRFKGTSKCGTRGDAIQEMDAAVGEVLATLDRLKLADNTLVIFTSDNGGVIDDGYADFGDRKHPCNGVLRGQKGGLYEGGHRIPFLARWPGKIKADTTSGALFAHVDMAATFAALTATPLPADAAPDSFNVLPALLGKKTDGPVRAPLILHNGGTTGPMAVRQGPWKLIAPPAKGKGRSQLFNLTDDLSETKNLAATMPDKVKELNAILEKCRTESRTRPR